MFELQALPYRRYAPYPQSDPQNWIGAKSILAVVVIFVVAGNMIRAITFRFRRKVMCLDKREDIDRADTDP